MRGRRLAFGGTVLAAMVAAGPVLGAGLPPTPPLPQPTGLPGAGLVPNLGTTGGVQVPGVTLGNQNSVTDPAQGGSFGAPFAQPGTSCPGETEGADPNDPYNANDPNAPTEGPSTDRTAKDIVCKPAGVSVIDLPTPTNAAHPGDANLLYWDGLESEENVQYNIVAEFGDKAANDQSRLLALDPRNPSKSTWSTPSPVDGGANGAPDTQYLLPNAGPLAPVLNDQGAASGALFCSDQLILANGEVMVPGGTDYYAEPKIPGTPYGVAELQGLRNTRVFDAGTGTWYESGEMNFGRWYPSLVTLGNGNVFVASGVTKLIKPVYTQPENALLSGTNVEQTETFNINTGKWTTNAPTADHSLPLFPRLHLLPDGHVYYDAGGQTFNPFGQSYDEALWNMTASYNPATQTWTDLGVPAGVSTGSGLNSAALTAGFRGSSFSMMMPLTPDASGRYSTASFLSAGGVLGVSPGSYLATASSILDTVSTAGGKETFTSTPTGALNNARWFSTGVELPTGQTIAFNGGNRDDVLLPGTSFPVTQAEMFDPATKKWTPLAASGDPRTYHNTAVLLPTGQVLVGGHSPISTGYGYNATLPGGFIKAFRDPSFQIYNPPYLNWGIAQPTISAVAGTHAVRLATGNFADANLGQTLTLATPQAASIDNVTLVRNTALTHEVDGDQREVVLPVISRTAKTVTVKVPASGNVVPAGPYMLFANEKTVKGDIPSVAQQLFVGAVASTTPAQAPSPGVGSGTYNQIYTNDTPAQLAALAGFISAPASGAAPQAPAAAAAGSATAGQAAEAVSPIGLGQGLLQYASSRR